MKAIIKFFKGVTIEMKRVRWPKPQELTRYSVVTISFLIFFALFFSLSNFIFAALKNLI
jgi:preprotein translocase subunit SecE